MWVGVCEGEFTPTIESQASGGSYVFEGKLRFRRKNEKRRKGK